VIDGGTVMIDPGTYIYTPIPSQRNTYRSVGAHFAPRMGDKEPGDISIGPFIIGGDPQSKAIYFGVHGFIGKHVGFGSPIYRRISVEDTAVVVTDCAPGGELNQCDYDRILFSPAYGIIQNEIGSRYEEID